MTTTYELNKKLDEGVNYIKLIFAELEEHKKILIEIKDAQTKMVDKLDTISEKLDRIANLLEQ